ncbi:MAG: hypothetical protein ABI045_06420 [Flavobacteriales bacterium]
MAMKAWMRLLKGSIFSVLLLNGFQCETAQVSDDVEIDGIYYNPTTGTITPNATVEKDFYESQYGDVKYNEYVPRVVGQYFNPLGNGPEDSISKNPDQSRININRLSLNYDFDYKNTWKPSRARNISYNVFRSYPYGEWDYPHHWTWNYDWCRGPFGHYWGFYYPAWVFSWSLDWDVDMSWPYPYWSWNYGWGDYPWYGYGHSWDTVYWGQPHHQKNQPVKYHEGFSKNYSSQDHHFTTPEYQNHPPHQQDHYENYRHHNNSSVDYNSQHGGSYQDRGIRYHEGFSRDYSSQGHRTNPNYPQNHPSYPSQGNSKL